MLSVGGPLLACGSTLGALVSMPPSRPRLKQDAKSAETRRRLLEAAIVCDRMQVRKQYWFGDRQRAGLSRGIQLYPFLTKEDLFAKASSTV